MTSTASSPTFGFPCPTDEDMANLGLYMQLLAMGFDATLQDIQDGLLSGLNRPTAIWSRSADITVAAAGATATTFANTFDTLVYSNYPQAWDGATLAFPPSHRPGQYQIGFWGQMVQSATVNAGTSRNIAIRVASYGNQPGLGGSGTIFTFATDYYEDSGVESNTAGEDLLVTGLVELPDLEFDPLIGGAGAIMDLTTHAESGGGGGLVALKAGCLMWLTFVSEGDQVQVIT